MQVIEKIQKGFMGAGLVTTCLLSFAVVVSLMLLTTPAALGPAGVTLWFLLVYTAIASLIMLLILGVSRQKVADISRAKFVNAVKAAVVPAGAITILLGMSSLGSLGMTDLLLVLGAAGIIELYLYTSGKRAA
jgi:hypothetical protein